MEPMCFNDNADIDFDEINRNNNRRRETSLLNSRDYLAGAVAAVASFYLIYQTTLPSTQLAGVAMASHLIGKTIELFLIDKNLFKDVSASFFDEEPAIIEEKDREKIKALFWRQGFIFAALNSAIIGLSTLKFASGVATTTQLMVICVAGSVAIQTLLELSLYLKEINTRNKYECIETPYKFVLAASLPLAFLSTLFFWRTIN